MGRGEPGRGGTIDIAWVDVQRCGRTAASCAVGCTNEEPCSQSVGSQCTAFSFVRGRQCAVYGVRPNASDLLPWGSLVIAVRLIRASFFLHHFNVRWIFAR